MKFKSVYIFYIIILTGLTIFASIFVGRQFLKSNDSLLSPLPNFLTVFKNNQVSTINLWVPFFEMFEEKKALENETPVISAKSALVYDLTSDKILFSKNPSEKLPIASLTKIMTAIVAIESKKTDDQYFVSEKDLVGENSMGLTTGEILSLEELIYGLILLSGNDASETLASNFQKGREEFVNSMNSKAKSLGLKNTNFTNPSGLEGDGNQYSTTEDLLVMTKYALNLPLFKETVKTFTHEIAESENHKAYYLENQTNLISSYPGVLGVKDGYTPEAGLCLVTYLEYKNHRIIAIILGSNDRRQEMKDLLDYSLRIQGITPPPHS